MPSDMEIVCPFCQARHPLMGTTSRPYPFGRSGDFNVYRCPCGAVGLPPDILNEADWTVHIRKELISCGFLQAESAACDVDMNYVTLTDPPMQMLWANRRARPTALK